MAGHMSERENLLRAIRRDSPHHVPWRRMDGAISGATVVNYRGSMPPLDGVDAWGVRWQGGVAGGQEWQPEIMAYAVAHPLADLALLEQYRFPDPEDPATMAGLLDGVDRKQSLVVGALPFLLFERAHLLAGMENLLLYMAMEPDRVWALLRRVADFQIRMVERYAEAGVEAIRATDDYGTQEALMVSPRMWRDLVKPELARICRAIKAAGLILFLHTCGRVVDIVPDLIEVGVDVLDPIQSLSNDLPALKREYGDQISFMGGVDTQYLLTRGTPAEIESTVRDRIRVMGAAGGYIIGPDNRIPISEENNRAFVGAIRRYGVYPLEEQGRNRPGVGGQTVRLICCTLPAPPSSPRNTLDATTCPSVWLAASFTAKGVLWRPR